VASLQSAWAYRAAGSSSSASSVLAGTTRSRRAPVAFSWLHGWGRWRRGRAASARPPPPVASRHVPPCFSMGTGCWDFIMAPPDTQRLGIGSGRISIEF
jgi:hypothetical protein